MAVLTVAGIAVSAPAWAQNLNGYRGPAAELQAINSNPDVLHKYENVLAQIAVKAVANDNLPPNTQLNLDVADVNTGLTALGLPNITTEEVRQELTLGFLNAAGALGSTISSSAQTQQEIDRNILDSAMSCPVFDGQTTLLGEDTCVWTKATGQRTDQYANSGNAGYRVSDMIYSIGGQKALAPGWFLGGSFAGGPVWSENAGSFDGNGRSFDGSVALKHIRGPWLFAGALAMGTLSSNYSTPSLATGAGKLSSSRNLFSTAARLRVAYDISFENWYIRPRADFDLIFAHLPAFQAVGNYQLGVAVEGANQLIPVLTPMVEFGGRVNAGQSGLIMRPYIAAGLSYNPNNKHTVNVDGLVQGDRLGSFDETYSAPSVVGDADVGLQLYQVKGFEVKAEYDVNAASAFLSQSINLRAAYHF